MVRTNISTIRPRQTSFPERLKHLSQIPDQLHVVGRELSGILDNPVVGIVGSRKVSNYGRSTTHDFASSLARRGVVIVSGLALGVDSIAHRACLEANGATIAVLPCGQDKIYPASHSGLAKSIVNHEGTLLSEYSGNEQPMRHYFIARNRIIAALSDVLLVTEAAQNSGSLYTANFALELGKPVFAVPGPIGSPTSKGTNSLIKSGAYPALAPEDILEELGISQTLKQTQAYLPESKAEAVIIKLLGQGIHDGAQLLSKSGLEPASFQQHLSLLEIKGAIQAGGNNTWSLK